MKKKEEEESKEDITFYGLDVSKRTLDLSGPEIKHRKFSNDTRGWEELARVLGGCGGRVHVSCEASGGYEIGVLGALYSSGIGVSRIHAEEVRSFARSRGQRAKNDRIDAAMLARFAQERRPRLWVPSEAARQELRALHDRRRQLVELRTKESNRLETALPQLAKLVRRSVDFYDQQIEEIDKLLDDHIDSDPALKAESQRFTQIQGVGRVTAATMLAHMPELGKVSDKEIAALAGLAPFANESGQFKGRRTIRGGRHQARCVLYMAALAAKRFNPILRDFYQRLIASGKPPKLAITAVMRKLVVLLNRVAKNPDFPLTTQHCC